MVVDTELHVNEHSAGSGQSLDVDRFPFGYADEPRENPGAMEGTLFQCVDGSILFSDFDAIAEGDVSEHFASARFKRSTDNGQTWSEPWHKTNSDGKPVECHHNTILNLGSGKLGMVCATRNVPKGRVGRDGGTMFATSSDHGQTWSDVSVIEPRFGICCTGHAIVVSTGRIVVPLFKWISYDPTGQAESS